MELFLVLFALCAAVIVVGVGWIVLHFGLAFMETEKPVWKRCKSCEGCGVVTIDGPIPLEHRSFYRQTKTTDLTVGIIQGPVANTRICLYCKGMGSSWHYTRRSYTGIPESNFFDNGSK